MALASLRPLAQIKQLARIDAAKSPAVAEALRALYKHLEQNPKELAWLPFTTSGAVDVVISDSPCKVYAVMLKKRAGSTVAAWFKASNHATVAALSGELTVALDATTPATKAQCLIFPDGLPFATGVTIASHTATGGTTDSAAADSQDGFFLVGAP